jgi:hypothetical protein
MVGALLFIKKKKNTNLRLLTPNTGQVWRRTQKQKGRHRPTASGASGGWEPQPPKITPTTNAEQPQTRTGVREAECRCEIINPTNWASFRGEILVSGKTITSSKKLPQSFRVVTLSQKMLSTFQETKAKRAGGITGPMLFYHIISS